MREKDTIWKEILLGKSLGRPVGKQYIELKYWNYKNRSILVSRYAIVLLWFSLVNAVLKGRNESLWVAIMIAVVGGALLCGSCLVYIVACMLEKNEMKQSEKKSINK